MTPKEQLKLLKRGISEVISEELLLEKLELAAKEKRPLLVKAGFDPSSSDIHLGHTVLLHKLRQFQDLGHQVLFIIGDATARVGDPSGRSKTRPMLSESDIKQNSKTYQDQAFKILNPKKTKTIFNNDWFGKMTCYDVMALASKVTTGQILQRDDFNKRMKSNQPISLLELFYPLMQGYDSVMIKADIELGGTDQKFNLLMGRELQKEYGQSEQAVMTMPLLIGLDGVKKMSKSLNNHIGILDSPNDMFGKIMSISDEAMMVYYEYLTLEDLKKLKEDLKSGKVHPMDSKKKLGEIMVEAYHGKGLGAEARSYFEEVFSKNKLPDDMPVFVLKTPEMTIIQIMVESGLVKSGSEGRRLIKQKAVTYDDVIISDPNQIIQPASESPNVLRVGKRRFLQLKTP